MARRWQQVGGRWLGLVAALGSLNGCPRECEQPDADIHLVSAEQDPTLGTFEGQLDWLQSADQTSLRLQVSRQAEMARRSCDYAQVDLTWALESDDGAISEMHTARVGVDDAGVTIPQSQAFGIDVLALVQHGKLPDAPGIAARNPTATLSLVATSENELSVTVTVKSTTDHLTVAAGTLVRTP